MSWRSKRRTATEHADPEEDGMRPCKRRRGTATKPAEHTGLVLKHNPDTQQLLEEAKADRADNSEGHLVFNLFLFLAEVLQQACDAPQLKVL